MRSLTTVLAVAVLAIPAYATQIVNYGWEDGGTLVGPTTGMYPAGSVTPANVTAPDPVNSGTRSLKLTGNATGTLQAYVAWIKGLQVGDSVTVSYWVYDTGTPSARIWAHWNDNPLNSVGFSGSASGNSTYSTNNAWSQLSYTWTVPAPTPPALAHTGLVIENRLYSASGASLYLDDMQISAPDAATVITPEPATMALLGLGALAMLRRRK